jgi:hypothetical protein
MVIYDQWSYMTMLLYEIIPPRSAYLKKYYYKNQFVKLILIELRLPGTKCEGMVMDGMNFLIAAYAEKFPNDTNPCVLSLLRGGFS